MPAFGLQGDETVQQMMNRINAATPRAAEGCLPNGKARTEENIQELLELVKQGCPDGTAWNASVRYEYKAPKLGPTTSCLSFGMAVGDFVFGEQAPVTQRWEGFTLRVGDRSTSRPKARSVFRSSPGWTMKRTPIPSAGSSGTAR